MAVKGRLLAEGWYKASYIKSYILFADKKREITTVVVTYCLKLENDEEVEYIQSYPFENRIRSKLNKLISAYNGSPEEYDMTDYFDFDSLHRCDILLHIAQFTSNQKTYNYISEYKIHRYPIREIVKRTNGRKYYSSKS